MIEVPTRRPDARLQPLLAGVLILNLLTATMRDLPLPVLLSFWALAGVFVVVVVAGNRRASRQRPRVQVLPDVLRVPLGDDTPVEIDWAEVEACEVRRRWLVPHLVVRPVDPDRLRPPPDRWQRAAFSGNRGYRIEVPLGGGRAARAALRAELAARGKIRPE